MKHCGMASFMRVDVLGGAFSHRRDGRIRVPVDGINPTVFLFPDKKFLISPARLLMVPCHATDCS